jgi:hypothetical protein
MRSLNSKTPEPSNVDMYLLDVVADDVESLDDVLRRLNADTERAWWRARGIPFGREEVVQALSRLVLRDWVRVYLPDPHDGRLVEAAPTALPPSDYSNAWFKITPRGLLVHGSWQPKDSEREEES